MNAPSVQHEHLVLVLLVVRQLANSSLYRELCPVHRGLIAMSGSPRKIPAE